MKISAVAAGFFLGGTAGVLICHLWASGNIERFERERDAALSLDSASAAVIDSLRAANDSLEDRTAVLRARLDLALTDVDSLIARGPRVVRIVQGGPAVPLDTGDFVRLEEWNRLATSCSAASVLCRQTADSLTLLADQREAEADAATERADSLAKRVAAFTSPASCRVLFFPCPSRTVSAVAGAVFGASLTYAVTR